MFKFYDVDVISNILSVFKVQKAVISSLSGNVDDNKILECIERAGVDYSLIGPKNQSDEYLVQDEIINEISDCKNYEAIFLNDDPNWYTILNELDIIKKTNDEFPLVFICNCVFPYKRRDAYIDPKAIPDEFLNDCSKGLKINDVNIYDGFYHANQNNTPKNGVLTAVEDFIAKNSDIALCDIKLSNGIIILHSKNSINQIRISKLEEEIGESSLIYDDALDSQIENKLLKEFINNIDGSSADLNSISELKHLLNEKEKLIKDYEYKISLSNATIDNKITQVKDINSKLSLKDSQIENFKSKLKNNDHQINELNAQLEEANSEIVSLNHRLHEREQKFHDKQTYLNENIVSANNQVNLLKENIRQKELNFNARETKLINDLEDNNTKLQDANSKIGQLTENNNNLKSIVNKKEKDIASLNEVISNKDGDIASLNKTISLKNNQIKDNANKINDLNKSIENTDNLVKTTLDSLKKQNTTHLSKLESKEYCISCYKEKIDSNSLEIQYLKSDSLIKRILNPFSYLYLILKSNPKELSLNVKLYRAIKDSKCFDIGYYLNNNRDILDSKWYKYFSPELHYVCNGFKENRKFNKKYFNRNSKKELLDYILMCNS